MNAELSPSSLARLFHRACARVGAEAIVEPGPRYVARIEDEEDIPDGEIELTIDGSGEIRIVRENITSADAPAGAELIAHLRKDLQRRIPLERTHFASYREVLELVERRFETSPIDETMRQIDAPRDEADRESDEGYGVTLDVEISHGEEWVVVSAELENSELLGDSAALEESYDLDGLWLVRAPDDEAIEVRATFPVAYLTAARLLEMIGDVSWESYAIDDRTTGGDDEDDEGAVDGDA